MKFEATTLRYKLRNSQDYNMTFEAHSLHDNNSIVFCLSAHRYIVYMSIYLSSLQYLVYMYKIIACIHVGSNVLAILDLACLFSDGGQQED